MKISDVRVKLITDSGDRLKAVCAVTFDEEFVVRDVKVVAGTNGLFVAMPSRKVSTHCSKCGFKNAIRSRFCNECGAKIPPAELTEDENGRSRFHRDIAHPITTPFREMLQAGVIKAYENEMGGNGQSNMESDTEDEDRTGVQDYAGDAADDEQGQEVTEYDAIIAGLRSSVGRGGGRPASSDARPRERTGSTQRRDDRGPNARKERSSERPPRSSERSSGGRRDNEAPPRGNRRGKAEDRGRTRGVVTDSPPAIENSSEPGDDFGAGIVAEQSAPVRPVKQERKQAPVQPTKQAAVTTPQDDQDNSFGEGIL